MTGNPLISNSKPLPKSRSLSTTLHSSSPATNLPNSNLLKPSTNYLLITVASDISTPTNSNSVTKSNSNITQKPKTENCLAKLEISNGCLSTDLQFIQPCFGITFQKFEKQVQPKSKFPELFESPGYPRKHLNQQPKNLPEANN
ncbi:hypothetical protein G9A89_007748 [Geosiphon pyriformis]|nr:hypothetical protein G9A89_007748 [Geosiphon pyriformis]